jgi:hypothetical protein
MSLRRDVLKFYKNVIKISNNWNAIDQSKTQEERLYIKDEARTLFRINKNVWVSFECILSGSWAVFLIQQTFLCSLKVSNPDHIREHMREAEARVEIALHYKIPYPRPVSYTCGTYPLSLVEYLEVKQTVIKKKTYFFVKVNLPTYTVHTTKQMKLEQRLKKQSTPVYLKSYVEDGDDQNQEHR